MNYEAGLLAFLLFYIPLYFVYKTFKESNKQADDRYQQSMNNEKRN